MLLAILTRGGCHEEVARKVVTSILSINGDTVVHGVSLGVEDDFDDFVGPLLLPAERGLYGEARPPRISSAVREVP